MPRHNRVKHKQQHGKVGKKSKRPRGWHRRWTSQGMREATRWLEQVA